MNVIRFSKGYRDDVENVKNFLAYVTWKEEYINDMEY
jgi:hypothetical protein